MIILSDGSRADGLFTANSIVEEEEGGYRLRRVAVVGYLSGRQGELGAPKGPNEGAPKLIKWAVSYQDLGGLGPLWGWAGRPDIHSSVQFCTYWTGLGTTDGM